MATILTRIIFIMIWALMAVTGPASSTGAHEIIRENLKNGLHVVIVRNTLAPVVTTELNYLAGSNEAPPGFPGMAHALEHMMFRGSPGLSAEQLASITAAMGGRSNALTQQTVTRYFFTVPTDLLEVVLRIEASRMQGVTAGEKLWDKERGAIKQEVSRDLSSPMYLFYSQLLEKMFAGTPYAHDALGTHASFDKTTWNMLKEFHNRWYGPNNAILVIAGDVDPLTTLAEVKKIFGKIPPRPIPPRPGIKLQQPMASTIKLDSNLPYGLAIVAYRLPGYKDPDFAAGLILADVLDSQRGNLYELVTEGKALFTGFDTTIFPEAGMGFTFAGFPKDADGKGLITLLKDIIRDYKKNGIPEDLVEASKQREITNAEFRKNSIKGLADEWSMALAVKGRNSPDDDIMAIKGVSVSDVNRVAQKYLTNNSAIVGLLIPRLSGKPMVQKGHQQVESFTRKETTPVDLPAWAEKALSRIPDPVSRLKPIVSTLSNGLRLIIQQEHISNTVNLFGRIKNNPGLQEPDGQEGVADLLDDLFSYGTVNLDRISFQKKLDEIAADLSAGREFSLMVMTKDFDQGIKLLSQNLLQPRLPEKAFKIVQKENMERLKGKLQSPSYLSRRALMSMLYPKNDPSLRQATPHSVGTLTLEDVRTFHKRNFRPDLTTIVLIGNVNPDGAKKTIEKYFGGWKAIGPKPETVPPPVPLNKAGAAVVPDRSRIQDRVTLAETLGLTRMEPDYYPLRLGLHVLSGGFYATRLYQDLRKDTGLVYMVEAFFKARKTRSIFGVVYGCDPENVSRVRSIVVNNLKEMQETYVTEEELDQAKTLMIHNILLSEASIYGIGNRLLELSTEDLPLDEPIRAARRYKKITAKEIKAAFAKWIRPEDLAQVTRGPEPH